MQRALNVPEDSSLEALATSWAEQLRARGVKPGALDEIVHDVFGDVGVMAANEVDESKADRILNNASMTASIANNGGFEEQIKVLILYHGIAEARMEIAVATSVLLGVTVH